MNQYDYGAPPPDIERVTTLKQPPCSIEAEQAVLAGLMMEGSRWDDVQDIITAGDFYKREHKIIFTAMQALAQRSQPIDIITTSEQASDVGQLHEAGGLAYFEVLLHSTHSTGNIVAYANVVKERAQLRRMITVAHGIADNGYNSEGRTSTELLEEAQKKLLDITAVTKGGDLIQMGSLAREVVKLIEQRADQKSGLVGISSGFRNVDTITAGLPESDLILLAGRPSMGKTTLALNIAERVAMADNMVFVFSAEMDSPGLIMRTYSNIGNIPHHRLRNGRLHEDDWDSLAQAVGKTRTWPLYIDESPAINCVQITSRVRRKVRELNRPVKLIVVDYIQIMSDAEKGKSQNERVSNISRGLKRIAKEFKCPVLALSQLNRDVDERPNKRPVPSDLRDSGALEQDADTIMFVYRDEVYHVHSIFKGITEVIIGKQRNGPLGTAYLDTILGFSRMIDRVDPLPRKNDPVQEPGAGGFEYKPDANKQRGTRKAGGKTPEQRPLYEDNRAGND
jgi:replicative DNA helicase